jgi:hypothetical protein
MLDLKDPFMKIELLQSLESVNQEVAGYFASIPRRAFFDHPSEAWSPAENLVHLLKSVSPVGKR